MMNSYLKFLILLTLSFFSILARAEDRQVFEFDDNKDGKVDNIFRYKNHRLVEHLNDRNYDGKFDYQMKVVGELTTIESDNNFDLNFDRVELIEKLEKESIYKLYRIENGKRILAIEKRIQNIQHSEAVNMCSYESFLNSISSLDNLISDFDPILEKLNNGFYEFTPGVKIHKSCLDNFGNDNFETLMRNSLDKGMSCLSELGTNNKETGAKGEIANIINLLNIQLSGKVKPTSIMCNQKDYSWDGTIAFASVGSNRHKSYGVNGPFISLNPKMKSGFLNSIKNGPPKDELEGVVFHELLHNLGYRHGHGVDVSYGCEVCCFSDNKSAKASACNICLGAYDPKNEIDPNYLRDMATLSSETGLVSAEIFIYKNISRIPVNQKNIDSVFLGLATRGPGVMQEFMRQIKERGLEVSEDGSRMKKYIKKANRYRPVNKFIAQVNEAYVSAVITGFIDKQATTAKFKLSRKIKSSDLREIASRNERDSEASSKLARGVEMIEQLF
ncbi:hypothetical protein M902_2414 [Bacteriovorax sp. BAL6_X]|uniref:hypothetical protein n=1 Tax=Bacteriovorax sp. BAL6_X TaxID=1201290 RepID=UPI00038568D4|nr:hypothetical protein [Bacteriovorax sp. BAL6_X]EPZ52123.1 hypothetical protein M902_2414 [Bacteriovorax sp. BAL6_X]